MNLISLVTFFYYCIYIKILVNHSQLINIHVFPCLTCEVLMSILNIIPIFKEGCLFSERCGFCWFCFFFGGGGGGVGVTYFRTPAVYNSWPAQLKIAQVVTALLVKQCRNNTVIMAEQCYSTNNAVHYCFNDVVHA